MAKADSQEPSRKLLHTLKISQAERLHLRQAAASRGTTMSDLIRDALRREGALPAQ